MSLEQFIEGVNLSSLHTTLCLIGVAACVWCHQLWGRGLFGTENTPVVSAMQRFAFVGIALAMIWALAYAHNRYWQPWPAYVMLLAAVDMFLVSIVMAAGFKNRIMG